MSSSEVEIARVDKDICKRYQKHVKKLYERAIRNLKAHGKVEVKTDNLAVRNEDVKADTDFSHGD